MKLDLSRIFPPPTYLTMPAMGVDISDSSLKYMMIKASSRAHQSKKLVSWGDIDIPSGTVERGQVTNSERLVSVLKEFKVKTKAELINVSLPEEKAYLFETEIKRDTPIKEIRSLLEFRLEENVPIPSRDIYFDYRILPDDGERSSVQVSVVAYAKETIQKYFDACVESGLRPVSFEVEAQAVARAMIPHGIKGAAMLVDFGKTRTGIGIVHKGALLYTSTIDIGGETLSQSLRKVLGADIAESELTKLKNTQGLIRTIDSALVYEAVLGAVSVIKDDIATRMQYWHLRNGNSDARRINTIVLAGGSSNLKGLPAYISQSIGITCVRGNVWENTLSLSDTVPPIDRPHSFGYATAVGLALKHTM